MPLQPTRYAHIETLTPVLKADHFKVAKYCPRLILLERKSVTDSWTDAVFAEYPHHYLLV